MKIDMNVEGVSFELIPENEGEKAFLESWWACGNFGSIDIHYRFKNIKTGSIGLRLYKPMAEMLKARPIESKVNKDDEAQ